MLEYKIVGNILFRSTLALAVLLGITACQPSAEQSAQGEAALRVVDVVSIQPKPLVQTEELPGRVVAVRQAEVRARVAGIVISRDFIEGSDVQVGQLLFQLDPAPFQTALNKAKAEQAKAEAVLADTEAVSARYVQLVKINAVSQQEFDAAKANLLSAKAALLAARADVEAAQLNLNYTRIKAPIAGRIGRSLVSEGALVGQNEATHMATIQQLDPVYVDFSQSSQSELFRQHNLRQGQLEQPQALHIVGNDGAVQQTGRLLFADSQVDTATGTVRLRGEFANPDQQLLAGMYVRVATRLFSNPSAILVPQRAVQRSSDGAAKVWLVNASGQAEQRTVSTGEMQGSDWHILQGLNAGDQVIIGGGNMLQEGEPVMIQAPAQTPKMSSEAVDDHSTAPMM